MNREELSRLTADIPKEYHIKLKSVALISGKSIRTVIMELIDTLDLEAIDAKSMGDVTSDPDAQKVYRRLVKKYEPALKKLSKN